MEDNKGFGRNIAYIYENLQVCVFIQFRQVLSGHLCGYLNVTQV